MKKIYAFEYDSDNELLNLLKQAVREVLNEQQLLVPVANSPPVKLEVLTSKEVCDLLHISYPTLMKYRREGKISSKLIGGKYYYLKSDVEKALTADNKRRRA